MRKVLLGLCALLVVSCDSRKNVREEVAVLEVTTLKSAYGSYFMIGNIISGPNLDDERFGVLTEQYNIVTAENDMKPEPLQRSKGVFTFERADAIVKRASDAGLKVHGHTLAWHQQSPSWMNGEGVSREEAIENLITHASTVAGHFKGQVVSWDVLNEAIIDNPPEPSDWRASLRRSRWYETIGPEFIEIVFKAAQEADPDAKLYYNDYNLNNQSKALAVYNMVKELNEKNLSISGRTLIDGIGMQGHYSVRVNPADVEASLALFVSLGVEVSITELDVQSGVNFHQTETEKIEQALTFAHLFSIFKKYAKNIGRVTMWGIDDGTSWRKANNPVMFDGALQPKPAFYAALNPEKFIEEDKWSRRIADESLAQNINKADVHYGTPVIDGKDEGIWKEAAEIPVDQFLMAWQGALGTAKLLWDERNLYVLVTVKNAVLNKASKNTYEQDSVEVFVDENNAKTRFFEKGDGQYRVNFDNETSFNPSSIADGFVSATSVSKESYTVEMKIPFKTISPSNGALIGFDVQINGASPDGVRQSVAMWNDISGNSYQDTSGYGIIKLYN
jgi:endo-1,4-beta-xylanase